MSHGAKSARNVQNAIAEKAMRVIRSLADVQRAMALSRTKFAEAQQVIKISHEKVG